MIQKWNKGNKMTKIPKLRFKWSSIFIVLNYIFSTVCFSLSFLLYQSLLPFPLPPIFVLLLHFKPLQFFGVSLWHFKQLSLLYWQSACICMCVLHVITTCWDSCAVLVIMGPLKWDCWHSDASPVHRVICPNPLHNITLGCTVQCPHTLFTASVPVRCTALCSEDRETQRMSITFPPMTFLYLQQNK